MKVLAIDSSGLVASVAVAEDGVLLAEYTIHHKKTHSQTLLPMLEEVKKMIELDLESVDYIAVAAGPGSFTGLRIGSATAKGLALALKKDIVEVPTLEGLAYNLWGTDKYICPIIDARRNQVYTGVYHFQGEALTVIKEQCAMDMEELLDFCQTLEGQVIFLGDGVPVYKECIKARSEEKYVFAPSHRSHQNAGSVAALAMVYAKQGKIVSAAAHEPEYLRKSQAEREREEKNSDSNS
ncbi:MAG: tRNA (adenosine(37)-N6)-threonylcarbamoyltransferase complex dimerization subunit type 1 TsaB [Lachnospiraceae bacterium]|nr:tRNA (adenosine(37)-N6)-threonylcarbamoyltransferase complex dimerization subunit type 1 TsaB [Lachnospiraceae bacterium]